MARRSSGLLFGHYSKGVPVKGLAEILDHLEAIPEAAKAAVMADIVDPSADEFVERAQAVAPASDLEPHAGALKESIRKQDGRHELSRQVVCDPKDEHGKGYAPAVEFGHQEVLFGKPTGRRVPPEPFWFPTYRTLKDRLRNRARRRMGRIVRETSQ